MPTKKKSSFTVRLLHLLWRRRVFRFFELEPDWAIVILTIGMVIVGVLQWLAIDGQLGEMKSAGAQTDQLLGLYQQQLTELKKQAGDTHRLADAAGKQAEAAKAAAASMADQVKKLQAGVEQTTNLALRAKEANAQSERALTTQTRPWVDISIEGVELHRSQSAGVPAYTFAVKYNLRNYGSAPALRLVAMFAFRSEGDAMMHYTTFCNAALKQSEDKYAFTQTIFPGPLIPMSSPADGTNDVTQYVSAEGCVAYRGIVGTDKYFTLVHFTFQPRVQPDGSIVADELRVVWVETQ